MGRGKVAPPIKNGDWTSVRKAINRLSAIVLGSEATPTFAGLTLTNLTASRLMATDASKVLASVGDLTSWIAGTSNQIAVADDSDGSVTLSTPQDIHTGASPTFAGVTLNNTGLHLLDTGGDHDLIIKPGSDVSEDRTLTLTTGDSDRTITLTGNPTLADWFDQSVKKAASPTFVGLILDKASGNGIKVDTATPTFGWRDLEGFEIPDPTGGDRPTLSTYSGGLIKENAFSNGDVLRIRYHIPHDYKKGTDIFSHIHWSHNGTAISGNVVFGITSDYAKGHNQANFGIEKSISIIYDTVDISTTPQRRQRIEESAITNDGGSATLIDRELLEPDGIILVTFEVTTNPTITGGSPNNVFVHRADLHYQSTNIATKDKVPDFYA